MKSIAAITAVWIAVAQPAFAQLSPQIKLNTVGYRPDQTKRASIAAACTEFVVVRASNGQAVLTGTTEGPTRNPDTGEELSTADFSQLREPGTYRRSIPGVGDSPSFRIGHDVFRAPFELATRAMYLWRCGTAVSATHEGEVFSHGPCHLEDAWLDELEGQHAQRNSRGGWHDAGDYNKYVVNAGVTVGAMFRAWEDFGPAIHKTHPHPQASGSRLPQFLAELQWETDWLFTMQLPSGAVSHKVSTRKFGGFVMPEAESAERFFTDWSSAATADFVAMMAQAARNFAPYDPEYANRCRAAALQSYGFLQSVPTNRPANLSGFTTGTYATQDADDRLWAAAELWATTGEPAVLKDLETRIAAIGGRVREDFDWGEVSNLGLFTYLKCQRPGRDASLLEKTRSELIAAADRICETAAAHGYQRPLGARYYWGCNGSVARQSLVLQAAFEVEPKAVYRQAIGQAVDHLLGRNFHGRSYVTGLGHHPPRYPHDRRSGGDTVPAPWPGYLVGGPHPKPANWEDAQKDYRTNEIAINWNGALVYALAALLPH